MWTLALAIIYLFILLMNRTSGLHFGWHFQDDVLITLIRLLEGRIRCLLVVPRIVLRALTQI